MVPTTADSANEEKKTCRYQPEVSDVSNNKLRASTAEAEEVRSTSVFITSFCIIIQIALKAVRNQCCGQRKAIIV